MTTKEKIEVRISLLETQLVGSEMLMATGNRFAEAAAVVLREDIRWLKWVLERMEEDG